MFVRDYMTTDLTCVQETDTLLDARMILLRSSFRHLPVVRGKQVVGIVTERDVKQYAPSLLTGISADEYNQVMESTPIGRIMTPNPMTLRPDQPIYEAAQRLYSKRIGCLPVVENGDLVGIVTVTDILRLAIQLMEIQGLAPGGSPPLPA